MSPTATVLPVSRRVSWEEFALWFDALIRSNPDRVLRSKGIIHTPTGPLVLQSVGPTIPAPTPAATATLTDADATEFVFITNGIDQAKLTESFRTFVPTGATG